MKEFLHKKQEEEVNPLAAVLNKRRECAENLKKEKEDKKKLEKER